MLQSWEQMAQRSVVDGESEQTNNELGLGSCRKLAGEFDVALYEHVVGSWG